MKVDLIDGDEGTIGEDLNLMPTFIRPAILLTNDYEDFDEAERRFLMTDKQLEIWQQRYGK